ncbi:MAG: 50S ribosomal protein L17 [Omnitrophica bacterium GWA2_52_12]|nr:MAG: 50S ribosomal protein L17 [Omnitrophica bacterium GWA2_52_12]
MRHQRLRRKLGVKSQHRRALLRNLVKSLVLRKRIRTTLAKAKEASAFADKMMTLAKRGDLHARRLLIAELGCESSAASMIKDIAPHFKERHGGYTRILRLMPRPGDNSQMALLEFTAVIAVPEKPKTAKPKKAKTAAKPEAEAVKTEAPKTSKTKKTPAAAEQAEKTAEDKKDAEKKGGFLGSLRKFLKGDE